MKKAGIITIVLVCAVIGMGATLFQENFTGGTTDNEWKALTELGPAGYETWYDDNLQVVEVSEVPGGAGAPPGNASGYVGKIIDANRSYDGIAAAYATATTGITDFIYEAWVYCYDAEINGSNPQGGIVGRISDCEHYVRYFADLGNTTSPRLRINTYTGSWDLYSYDSRTETAGWHKMKMKVEGGEVTVWFDDMDNPVATETPSALDPGSGSVTEGHIGVQVMHYAGDPTVGIYYDQILVTDLAGPSTPTPEPTAPPANAVEMDWTIYE